MFTCHLKGNVQHKIINNVAKNPRLVNIDLHNIQQPEHVNGEPKKQTAAWIKILITGRL